MRSRATNDGQGGEASGLRVGVWARRVLHAFSVFAVLFVSLWPRACVDAYVADGIQRQERWIHLGCFAALGALSAWAYGRSAVPVRSRLATWIGCTVFGLVLEVLQAVLPGVNRSGTVQDGLDNAAGAAIGVLCVPVACWPRRRNEGVSDDEPAA